MNRIRLQDNDNTIILYCDFDGDTYEFPKGYIPLVILREEDLKWIDFHVKRIIKHQESDYYQWAKERTR